MKKWTTKEKSNWLRGEWDDEPDKAQWIDKATGLDCLIVRGPTGALCGYVGVPECSPLYKKEYTQVDEIIDVHGGLTFSKACNPNGNESTDICHTGDVANKTVWWFGFDCAHGQDFTPAYSRHKIFSYEIYRNFSYVKNQVTKLAKQLKKDFK